MTASTTVPRADVGPDAGEAVEPFAAGPVLAIAAALTAALVALSWRYGYHRDELYYLWGGEHPAWGYVDHPPLVPLLAHAVDVLGGHTLIALRAVAALMAAWLAVSAALIARELGGSRRAQVLAAFASACVPATRAPEILYGTTAADAAVWAIVLVLTARLLRTRDPRMWVWIGLATGIGFETKWSIGLLVAGIVVGLALSPQRGLLRSPWTVVGGLLALTLWVPNLWWNATHDWPFLEFQRNLAAANGTLDKRLLFFPMLLLLTGVAPIVVWLPGWSWLQRGAFRAISLACVVITAAVFLAAGKPYYLTPLVLPLLAAGAIVLDRGTDPRRRTGIVVLAVTALCTIPMTLPVLPPGALNAVKPINPEMGEMIGWSELVAETRQAFDSLPAAERAHAVILTSNYGSATALLRDAPDLPVFSAHNSLWFAGPPPATATTVVTVGYLAKALERWCGSLTQLGVVTNPAGVDNQEAGRPIQACRGLKAPWSTLWPDLKHFS